MQVPAESGISLVCAWSPAVHFRAWNHTHDVMHKHGLYSPFGSDAASMASIAAAFSTNRRNRFPQSRRWLKCLSGLAYRSSLSISLDLLRANLEDGHLACCVHLGLADDPKRVGHFLAGDPRLAAASSACYSHPCGSPKPLISFTSTPLCLTLRFRIVRLQRLHEKEPSSTPTKVNRTPPMMPPTMPYRLPMLRSPATPQRQPITPIGVPFDFSIEPVEMSSRWI